MESSFTRTPSVSTATSFLPSYEKDTFSISSFSTALTKSEYRMFSTVCTDRCIIAGGAWPPALAKGEAGGGTSTAIAGEENAIVAAASIAAREAGALNPSPFIAIAGATDCIGLTAVLALSADDDLVKAPAVGAPVPTR
ncbi:unnamed protein product, partial [Ectocarpus sp. 12 AP-2014]